MGFRYIVRQAKPEDCGSILKLIYEWAELGKDPDRVVQNTEEDLRDNGFGDHPIFQSIVAEAIDDGDSTDEAQRGTMVGYAIYICTYSAWTGGVIYLDDLFIQPAHRGKGVGKAMVCKVAKIGAQKGCQGMQMFMQGSNKAARQFFDGFNAVDISEKDGWSVMCVQGDHLSQLGNYLTEPEVKNDIQFLC
ncbi:diamine acetyltransferase 2-like [Acanthaster planci]|uniref:Diamine acetyltransferase 2-like n=1 Tax=Acanthaster planci TaxID=133434 RepID=A0A8B7ZAR9_ACAPL|nr:diamine acetyltransferase 2-like [Acanthaster planci]